MQLSAVRRGVQTPFMKWATQFLGGRTAAADEYMRYSNYMAPRTYPARQTPPSENEKLHSVTYIYRDNRRLVEPPTVVHSVADGVTTPIASARPTPGFGLQWSLNAEDPVVRTNADFGLKPGRDFVQGYSEEDFYKSS